MKKKGLIISLLLLFIFSIQVNSNDKFKRITLTESETNFSGTLTNSGTNKYPADTLFLDFSQNSLNYLLTDTIVISLKIDSVAGKYGSKKSDSLGRNKVQMKYKGVVAYPTSNTFGYGNYTTKDTIVTTSNASFTDSITNWGGFVNYTKFRKYLQTFIIIKHNYGDTSKVNPRAITNYTGRIGVKKTDPF